MIIIMTSNVGARFNNAPAIGFGATDRNVKDDKILKETFSPEFLNRLDAMVDFEPLSKVNILRIVDKFLGELFEMAAKKNVTIDVNEDAKEWLADHGYDKAMGARPLSRVIQENIKVPMSKEILFGALKNGGHAVIGTKHGELAIAYEDLPEVPMPVLDAVEEV